MKRTPRNYVGTKSDKDRIEKCSHKPASLLSLALTRSIDIKLISINSPSDLETVLTLLIK